MNFIEYFLPDDGIGAGDYSVNIPVVISSSKKLNSRENLPWRRRAAFTKGKCYTITRVLTMDRCSYDCTFVDDDCVYSILPDKFFELDIKTLAQSKASLEQEYALEKGRVANLTEQLDGATSTLSKISAFINALSISDVKQIIEQWEEGK